MRTTVATSLIVNPARLILATLLLTYLATSFSSANVIAHLSFEEFTSIMDLSRSKRGVSSQHATGALCKRTRRDVAALKTILSRNARTFSHEIWIADGVNLSGSEHTRITAGSPELSIDAMIDFLRDFERFLQAYARSHRQSVSPRVLRPLVLKVRKLRGELLDLLIMQRPNYSRSSHHVENLQRHHPAVNMADHVTALLSNVDRSVIKLCADVTTTRREHYALKVR